MKEPDFHESLISHVFYSSLQRSYYKAFQHPVRVFIPSLIEEWELAYDMGLYVPFLGIPPDSQGLNYFIQFKIAKLQDNPRASLWTDWKREFYEYSLFYSKNGGRDYHQQEQLRNLSRNGFPTYYVSNETLHRDQLEQSAFDGSISKRLRFIDLNKFTGNHDYATYAVGSPHVLHSDPQEFPRLEFDGLSDLFRNKDYLAFSESVSRLINYLRVYESDNRREGYGESVGTLSDQIRDRFSDNDEDTRMLRYTSLYQLARSRFRLYFDVHCNWFRGSPR